MYCSGEESRPPYIAKEQKPCPIANKKALTSWSNWSNEFLRPAGFDESKWRASGTQLAAKTGHSECRFRIVRMSEIRCMWLTKICNLLPR